MVCGNHLSVVETVATASGASHIQKTYCVPLLYRNFTFFKLTVKNLILPYTYCTKLWQFYRWIATLLKRTGRNIWSKNSEFNVGPSLIVYIQFSSRLINLLLVFWEYSLGQLCRQRWWLLGVFTVLTVVCLKLLYPWYSNDYYTNLHCLLSTSNAHERSIENPGKPHSIFSQNSDIFKPPLLHFNVCELQSQCRLVRRYESPTGLQGCKLYRYLKSVLGIFPVPFWLDHAPIYGYIWSIPHHLSPCAGMAT